MEAHNMWCSTCGHTYLANKGTKQQCPECLGPNVCLIHKSKSVEESKEPLWECLSCKATFMQPKIVFPRLYVCPICNSYDIKPSEGIAFDEINHPQHYTSHPSGIECIQVTEHMPFNLGSAVKYIWRAGQKGNVIVDLKKARWYINREIQRLEREADNDTGSKD